MGAMVDGHGPSCFFDGEEYLKNPVQPCLCSFKRKCRTQRPVRHLLRYVPLPRFASDL
jgi:hypothetical protein